MGKTYNIESAEWNNRTTVNEPFLDSVHLSPKHVTKKKKTANAKEEITDDDDLTLTSCGIGSWRPAWLQMFASPIFFMANMALIGIIQSMTGTLFYSSISTFERRYAFDSKISGIIMIADNFAEMILNPLVGYFGVRYNRARLMAIGEMVLAISCFLTATPFFIYGSTEHSIVDQQKISSLSSLVKSNWTTGEMCSQVEREDNCENYQSNTVWLAVFFLIAGSFARGLGYTCYFVIGFPYLDDNLSKKQSPFYISAMQAIRLIGPSAGFLLSSFCLRMYENPFVDPGFSRNDPRFVGAWWLSFCITGVLLFIVSLPMFLFPPQFQNASVKTKDINKKIKQSGGSVGALKRFVTNPLVMLYLLGNVFRYNGLGGIIMFKSKYIESQYQQSSSSASFLTGFSSFMPMAIGILAGGLYITFLKPRPVTIFILVFLVESVSIFSVGSGFFLGCDTVNIQGHTSPGEGGMEYSLRSSCNKDCYCTTRVFSPVCAPDQMTTYFSACHAGCVEYNALNETFERCSCFSGSATKGFCRTDTSTCTHNLKWYIGISVVSGIISSISRAPNALIALRSVDDIDKGFTIGLSSTLMDIFSFIPYPLLFGYVTDAACHIWESKCGKTGNCWVYDNQKFRNYLHGLAVFFVIFGSVFDFLMIFYAKRVRNFYDDDADNGENNHYDSNDANRQQPKQVSTQQLELQHLPDLSQLIAAQTNDEKIELKSLIMKTAEENGADKENSNDNNNSNVFQTKHTLV